MVDNKKLHFSGHESFHCRNLWLKKGFDFIHSGHQFSEDSGIELGIGRNMVEALKHWLKSFNLIDENGVLTEWAINTFSDNGWDPYLEDEATLWMLHFHLIKKEYASAYPIVFTELRKTHPDFSVVHFSKLVLEKDTKQNENTLIRDFSVLIRNYVAQKGTDREENYTGLLHELNLLHEVKSGNNSLYHIENNKQSTIPAHLILYCILAFEDFEQSISTKSLMGKGTTLGNIFVMTPEMLEIKLIEACELIPDLVYVNDSGIKELQFKGKKPHPMDVLKSYYAN